MGGEVRGIVRDPDADPALVVRQIIDAVRNGLAQSCPGSRARGPFRDYPSAAIPVRRS